jgi:hypothetical protein
MMTDNQRKLIEISKLYENLRDQMKEVSAALGDVTAAVAKESGLGTFFQDSDGTVFRVAKATGTYVPYKELVYERTRRHPKEKPGISLKDARDAGFDVK